MKPQVLLVSPWAEIGGTERYVANLAAGLNGRGWRVSILAPPGPAQRWWSATGARLQTFGGGSDRSWWRRVQAFRRLVQAWERTVRSEGDPSLVHVQAAPEYLGYLSAWRRWGRGRDGGGDRGGGSGGGRPPALPVVFTSHGFAGALVGWDYGWAAWAARHWSDRVIAVSRSEGERLVRAGLPRDRLTVIPNAIPLPVGRPGTGQTRPIEKPAGQSGTTTLTIGFVGRLSAEKGVSCFLEAVRRWWTSQSRPGDPRKLRVLIVGDGADRPALERQAATIAQDRRDLSVEFLGYVDPEPWWPQMDLVVVPSVRDAAPLVVLEAMAAGRPVMASNLPGILEVLRHGHTGWVVPAGECDAWAESLARVAADSSLRQRLGEEAQQHVRQHLSQESLVMATEAVYRQVLCERGGCS